MEHGAGDGLSDVAVLEEAVARLVAKYTHEAAKVLQRVGRGYLGRQRTAKTRHTRDTHKRVTKVGVEPRWNRGGKGGIGGVLCFAWVLRRVRHLCGMCMRQLVLRRVVYVHGGVYRRRPRSRRASAASAPST